MTWVDMYLRAESEEELKSVCPFLVGEDGDWLIAGEGFAFDPIGPVVLVPGIYDDEGGVITPPVVDARYHANLRCTPEIAAQVPEHIKVYPDTPARVWL